MELWRTGWDINRILTVILLISIIVSICMVVYGVVNHEYADVSYRLEVKLDGAIIHTEQIDLAHDEAWEEPFTFKATVEGADQKLELLLYREGADEVYWSLHLWVDVAPPG
jgi:uncharacterized membrane protein